MSSFTEMHRHSDAAKSKHVVKHATSLGIELVPPHSDMSFEETFKFVVYSATHRDEAIKLVATLVLEGGREMYQRACIMLALGAFPVRTARHTKPVWNLERVGDAVIDDEGRFAGAESRTNDDMLDATIALANSVGAGEVFKTCAHCLALTTSYTDSVHMTDGSSEDFEACSCCQQYWSPVEGPDGGVK